MGADWPRDQQYVKPVSHASFLVPWCLSDFPSFDYMFNSVDIIDGGASVIADSRDTGANAAAFYSVTKFGTTWIMIAL